MQILLDGDLFKAILTFRKPGAEPADKWTERPDTADSANSEQMFDPASSATNPVGQKHSAASLHRMGTSGASANANPSNVLNCPGAADNPAEGIEPPPIYRPSRWRSDKNLRKHGQKK